jgi:esterase
MKNLLTVSLIATLLAACQSVQHRSMEAMEVKKLKVNDIEVAYVEEGKGDTVVVVHGASGDWRSYDALRPFIAKKYHYVALSRRYHYPNSWADDGKNYSIMQHVEDLAGFIRALNVGKVHLMGGSYGARVAGYTALKYPELLRSVVMSEPSLIAPTTPEGKAALAEYQKDIAKSSAAAKAGDEKQAAMLLWDAVWDEPDAFQKAPPARQQRWLDNAKTLAPMYAGPVPAPVSCEQLGALKVPVLVMGGGKSRANFRYGNEMLLSCLPKGTSFAVVPDAPHMWYPIHPQAGAEAILAFIAKH